MIDELTALETMIDDEPADDANDLESNPWAALPANYPACLDKVEPEVATRAILRTIAYVNRWENTPGGDSIPVAYVNILRAELHREQLFSQDVDALRAIPRRDDVWLTIARGLTEFGTSR